MAFPHPKSGENNYGKEEKPNRGGVVGNFFKRTVDVTQYRDTKYEVNPTKDRTFGGVVHDERVSQFFSGDRFIDRG